MKQFFRAIRNASLMKKQMFCFFLVSVIPMLVINASYFQFMRQNVMDQNDHVTDQLLLQTELTLNQSFHSVEALASTLIQDSEIEAILTSDADLPLEQQLTNRIYLQERLRTARSLHDWVTAVTLVSDSYQVSSTTQDLDYTCLLQEPWLREFMNGKQVRAYTGIYVNRYIGRYQIPVFSLLRQITDPETGERLGTLIVEMRYSSLEELFQEMEQPGTGMVLLTDARGNLLYSPDHHLLGSGCPDYGRLLACGKSGRPCSLPGDSRAVVHTRTVEKTGWTVIDLKYTDYLFDQATTAWSRMAVLCGALAVVVMLLAAGLSLCITQPISRLVEAMKRVESGDLEVTLPVESEDDVGVLVMGFNSMTAHLRRLIDRVYDTEREKRQAELQALQAQINPHFLYNTLGAVRWMAVMHNADSISRILLALIRLLEFSTKRTAEFVTVEDEVEHVQYYAQLLQIRYADKFSLETQIDPQTLQCRTIRFLLQPLVENAVFHGIEAKDGPGTVQLRIRRSGDRVEFSVQDDGVGMDEETVARKAFSGVGIHNVNQRLQSYFGADSCLQIDSELGRGTCVHFSIPYEPCQNPKKQEDKSCTEY